MSVGMTADINMRKLKTDYTDIGYPTQAVKVKVLGQLKKCQN